MTMTEYPSNPEHVSKKELAFWGVSAGALLGLGIIFPVSFGIGLVVAGVGAARANRFESTNRLRGISEAFSDNLKPN